LLAEFICSDTKTAWSKRCSFGNTACRFMFCK